MEIPKKKVIIEMSGNEYNHLTRSSRGVGLALEADTTGVIKTWTQKWTRMDFFMDRAEAMEETMAN